MKLIKPSFEILPQSEGLDGIYKQIELAGRTCYKSEDKITEDSAKGFVDRVVKSGHGAMLEHGTVYLKISDGKMYRDGAFRNFNEVFTDNLYYKVCSNEGIVYVTTNYRYIIENNLEHWLDYLCEPTEHHEKRITVKFICDRGVSHEFVRHRVFSFAQESTRYCNYSKDKFSNELTFIFPNWMDEELLNSYGLYHTVARSKTPESIFIAGLNNAEKDYLDLINMGWKPQEARAIFPNSLRTELVMTGSTSGWKHFFYLRTPVNAHPQARELAIPLKEEFIKRNLI